MCMPRPGPPKAAYSRSRAGATAPWTAQRTEMRRGESNAAPATICHTPTATVTASRPKKTACSQMSPAMDAARRPFPLAVALNETREQQKKTRASSMRHAALTYAHHSIWATGAESGGRGGGGRCGRSGVGRGGPCGRLGAPARSPTLPPQARTPAPQFSYACLIGDVGEPQGLQVAGGAHVVLDHLHDWRAWSGLG